MAELEPLDAWPPDPIRTGRLVLREPEARDRAAVIELNASPEVRAYLGGPQPRDELERVVPAEPRRRPGLFVVDLGGAMIGVVTIARRDADRPGTSAPMRARPSWATCSCRARGDAGTPPRPVRRSSPGPTTCCPASRWCSAPRPPTSARCVWRRGWGSPRWSASRSSVPSSGSE